MIKGDINRKSGFAKQLCAAVMAACCFFVVCACSESTVPGETLSASERNESIAREKSNRRVHEAIKNALGFDIDNESIDEAEMTSDAITTDTYGNIRIILKKENGTEVLQLFEKKLGDFRNIDASLIPNYQDHPYAFELKHMHSIKQWVISKNKNAVVSSDIDVYMAELNGDTIIYIFG